MSKKAAIGVSGSGARMIYLSFCMLVRIDSAKRFPCAIAQTPRALPEIPEALLQFSPRLLSSLRYPDADSLFPKGSDVALYGRIIEETCVRMGGPLRLGVRGTACPRRR